ncbi:MAG: metalloregulator ArsR/SmtB family transcription factor [Holophagae bacterium]|jgi:DNA-binding transcriptional ArsR family regulator
MSNLDHTAEISRALGHAARLRILAMLRSGELCVCQITEVLELAQSTVSGHLRELRRAGLVTERKDGRWVYFAPSDDPEAVRWLDAALTTATGDPRLEADRAMVEELRTLPLEDVCRFGYEEAKRRAVEPSPSTTARRQSDNANS